MSDVQKVVSNALSIKIKFSLGTENCFVIRYSDLKGSIKQNGYNLVQAIIPKHLDIQLFG